jgi:hypothetical protein
MNTRLLWIAIAVTICLSFLPFAQFITYPFLIFSTFIHETGHAIAALFTGGTVESLIVRMDGSGVTYTRGGLRFVISTAGYIGTAIFGGLLLVLSRKQSHVRSVLVGCAIFVLAVTAGFVGHTNNLLVLATLGAIVLLFSFSMKKSQSSEKTSIVPLTTGIGLSILLMAYLVFTKSLFSWSAGLLIATALLAAARIGSMQFAHFFLTFLAVQCSLNALDAIKKLYFISLRTSCGNDAAAMASMTGVPAWIWAIFWAILSIFILFISTVFYTRRSYRTTPIPI